MSIHDPLSVPGDQETEGTKWPKDWEAVSCTWHGCGTHKLTTVAISPRPVCIHIPSKSLGRVHPSLMGYWRLMVAGEGEVICVATGKLPMIL